MTTSFAPLTTTTALPRVVGAELPVPLVTGGTAEYANLDLAASAPALEDVAAHVTALLPYYSSVHRGAGYASQVCTSALESARATVGSFVGAREDDVVVFTRNTTDALNLLAACVPAFGQVLCLDIEHHANLLPWRRGRHRVLSAAATVEETIAELDSALRATPTTLLAITGASNVTGEVLPIARIVEIAHAAGARVVLDAAQLAPHRCIDIAALGVDYVALSGHKLYAPYGAGALIGRRDWLDAAQPYLAGGGAVREVAAGGVPTWATAPHRHEAGTPNVLGAAALAQACRTLAPVLAEAGPEHERTLLDRLRAGLDGIPGVSTLRIWPDSTERVAVLSFTVADRPAGYVAAYLSAEHGIGVRDGRFCAHPLLSRLNPGSGEALRASIGVGTTAEHVDRLVEALRALVTTGARWTYAPVDGRWAPTPDPRTIDPLGIGASAVATPGCGQR
ncbi:aminotransferase class V-fold PLP-dependent enzyme [Pseudonocardia sp. TRM90224]|uniref:aminotransferase class V-fold PLP-dependent enzyme n=1 Tax=Pseudonocardia sp. TRM90224 TaxID=2812678 RepID=UPI001E5EA6D4|nr:aminotransferase class V-fold PLP-dependent enzyme [Pseudonocardia sp. TRM90224]